MDPLTEPALLEVLSKYGLAVLLVLFFVWRDWQANKTLVARLQQVEDRQYQSLTALVKETTACIEANTKAIWASQKTQVDLVRVVTAQRSGARDEEALARLKDRPGNGGA